MEHLCNLDSSYMRFLLEGLVGFIAIKHPEVTCNHVFLSTCLILGFHSKDCHIAHFLLPGILRKKSQHRIQEVDF